MKISDLNLAGLEADNIENYYRTRFNRWLFDNSDNVFLDGKNVSKESKMSIKISLYNIQPPPKKISACGTVNKAVLSEKKFVEKEIERVKKLNDLSLEKEIIKESYLLFLNRKKQEKNKISTIKKIWQVIQLKPNFMGLGIDLKKLFKNLKL